MAASDPLGSGREWLLESLLASSLGLVATGTQLSPVAELESTWLTQGRHCGVISLFLCSLHQKPENKAAAGTPFLSPLGEMFSWGCC